LVFDINDFDDAVVGPCRWDVLRVLTSTILGARAKGLEGGDVLALAEAFTDSYQRALSGGGQKIRTPTTVERLLRRAGARTRPRLLAERCQVTDRGLRFIRGEHFRSLPAKLERAVRHAFGHYTHCLPAHLHSHPERLEILDVAFRIAGTGSLGVLRAGILTRGKGGRNGAWLFDAKEERESAAPWFGAAPTAQGGERIVAAASACLDHAPRLLGAARQGKLSFVIRPLSPQEDKLELARVEREEMEGLLVYLGMLTGAAHRRGAQTRPKMWTQSQCRHLWTAAIELAGLHEAAYLAYCLRTEPLQPRAQTLTSGR
jgi:uncharacterized protein (DUF2252 family)